MTDTFSVSGQLVDITNRRISPVSITITNGHIAAITPFAEAPKVFIMPGFIDAHVHVESSMLIPSEFARLAVVHGTVATVSDPHEIANVCGINGVDFMIENGKKVPFKFYFGAPSCVPATPFETAGGEITAKDIAELMGRKEVTYLAEMMNWPGTLERAPEVMEKIQIAQQYGKPVDGHAPGLKGDLARQYIAAGISTDHECFTQKEALSKLAHGMKILIREGSAAKNFEALIDLVDGHSDQLMFCSDDKHPDSLVLGHINQLVSRAIRKGKDLFDVLKAACINPIGHYSMEVGLLRVGDPADFIICDDLEDFRPLATYIDGKKVAENGKSLLESIPCTPINHFNCQPKSPGDFKLKMESDTIRAMEARDGQLITGEILKKLPAITEFAEPSIEDDLLKISVINRYRDAPPAIAFIKNFGLKEGAIASSVGHDSHNILVVGTSDESMARAANLIIKAKGGISAVSATEEKFLPLPVGGIMSDQDGYEVAKAYSTLDQMAKKMGTTLESPFMTLSFMALLVIPSLKLSDKGLFDGENFIFTSPFKFS